MKPLVYIAGPYSTPDPVENTRHAIRVGMMLYETGLAIVEIPHLTMLAHFLDPRPIDYWYDFDLDKLAHCDAVWRIKGESAGADKEVEEAWKLDIRVFTSVAHEWDKLIEFCRERVSA